jgi:hypothetical protein
MALRFLPVHTRMSLFDLVVGLIACSQRIFQTGCPGLMEIQMSKAIKACCVAIVFATATVASLAAKAAEAVADTPPGASSLSPGLGGTSVWFWLFWK